MNNSLNKTKLIQFLVKPLKTIPLRKLKTKMIKEASSGQVFKSYEIDINLNKAR